MNIVKTAFTSHAFRQVLNLENSLGLLDRSVINSGVIRKTT